MSTKDKDPRSGPWPALLARALQFPAQHYGRVAVWVALALLAGLFMTDLVSTPTLDYVGLYAALPFLVAIFASPNLAIFVGVASVTTAFFHGMLRDVEDTPAQMVRLTAIVLATLIAALSASVRERREARLAAVTHVAEVVQRSVLRPVPSRVGHLECGVRYFSAAESSNVGGDLYEVTDTPWGVRILLGDVRGKGLAAVRIATEVLGTFRHLAHTEEDLSRVVTGLDAAAGRAGEEEDFVTAVVVELRDDRATLLNCGHPAPVLVGDGTVTHLVPSDFSLPLGLGASPEVQEIDHGPGETLLLYTDGLTEARDDAGEFFPLLDEAGVLSEGADPGLDLLTERLREHVGGHLDDDVALLAVTWK